MTSAQKTLLILRGVSVMAIPVLAFLFLRKKGGRGYPTVIGIVTLILLMMPRGLIRALLVPQADGFLAQFILSDAIGACFEECGRFIAFKYALPNHDRFPDALCYGVGHGGVELWVTGINQFGILAKCLDGTATEGMLAQGGWDAAEIILGSPFALIFHMMMSVLVLLAANRENCRKYLLLAIVLHILANFIETFFGNIADILFTAGICYLTYRLYQNQMQTDHNTEVSI